MKIKIIEKTHELDLEDALNDFITNEKPEIINIHYSVAMTALNGNLEYSFSCLIEYSSSD
ncbi:MAG: sporulation protein Cse60 [Bacilli bacterium]|nr:sporulation protein Cse60 [Bacilli bacterium]